MPEKLKPCPFCGGEARIDKDPRYAAIMCKECGARVRQPISIELCAVDTVIKKWSRRAESVDS